VELRCRASWTSWETVPQVAIADTYTLILRPMLDCIAESQEG